MYTVCKLHFNALLSLQHAPGRLTSTNARQRHADTWSFAFTDGKPQLTGPRTPLPVYPTGDDGKQVRVKTGACACEDLSSIGHAAADANHQCTAARSPKELPYNLHAS